MVALPSEPNDAYLVYFEIGGGKEGKGEGRGRGGGDQLSCAQWPNRQTPDARGAKRSECLHSVT